MIRTGSGKKTQVVADLSHVPRVVVADVRALSLNCALRDIYSKVVANVIQKWPLQLRTDSPKHNTLKAGRQEGAKACGLQSPSLQCVWICVNFYRRESKVELGNIEWWASFWNGATSAVSALLDALQSAGSAAARKFPLLICHRPFASRVAYLCPGSSSTTV